MTYFSCPQPVEAGQLAGGTSRFPQQAPPLVRFADRPLRGLLILQGLEHVQARCSACGKDRGDDAHDDRHGREQQ